MYRVGITTLKGVTISRKFQTREKADEWILEVAEKEGVKKAIILNKETKEREFISF